jgi:uncharacterized integral membrane protein
MKRNARTPKPLKKKLNKSTRVYIYCGIGSAILLILLLIIYAVVAKINIGEFLVSRYAMFAYLAIGLFATVGIILVVKDKISRM